MLELGCVLMVWARFDDRYSENPKIVEAGPWAELLDMRGIIYACRNETDGAISTQALKRIGSGIPAAKRKVDQLIAVGRWEVNPSGGWWIHSFLEFNPSKAKLSEGREQGRKRAAGSRERNTNEMRTNGLVRADARTPTRDTQGSGHLEGQELPSDFARSEPPWVAAGLSREEWIRQGAPA